MISRKKAQAVLMPKKATNTSYTPKFGFVERSVIS